MKHIFKGKKVGPVRRFEFIGEHNSNNIVIGNHGDARFLARGNFNLSGILFCLHDAVEFRVHGHGKIRLAGKCKTLNIKSASGDCVLDFTGVKSDIVTCESISDNVTVLLGETKKIDSVTLSDHATLKLLSPTFIGACSLNKEARIIL